MDFFAFSKKKAANIRKSPALYLRRAAQTVSVLIMVLAAWQFSGFIDVLRNGGGVSSAYRPPVVEGFLPIAAITALRAGIHTGVFDTVHPAGLVILLATLATALLFRRALCSWLCPIGSLSEFLGALGARWKLSLSVPKWLDYSLLAMKYGLFIWIFKLFFLMDGEAALSFTRLPYYAVSDVKMFELFSNIGVIGAGFAGSLALASVFVKSFWCRYLCPYGALQGVLGLLSPFTLKKDAALCNSCGLCSRACPNRVDVAGAKSPVISPECMGCTDCVTACPKKGALTLRFPGFKSVRPLVFGLAFLALFFGAVGVAKCTGRWDSSLTLGDYRSLYRMMGR
ncbi:4Fe-4S binding protein [bacterium]|nr:MAG: 4Fe-4S binding protein [bacterium]